MYDPSETSEHDANKIISIPKQMPEGISEEVLTDLANKALVGTILVIIL